MSPGTKIGLFALTLMLVAGIWWGWLRQGDLDGGSGLELQGAAEETAALPPELPQDLTDLERELIPESRGDAKPEQESAEVTPVTGMVVKSDQPYDPNDPWFRLRFQVVDFQGQPIRNATLRMSYSYPAEKSDAEQTHTLPFEFQTDGQGRVDRPFALSDESTRHFILWFSESGTVRKARVSATLVSREVTDLGQVALLSPRERHPVALVTGTVRSDEGELTPGVVAAISHRQLQPGLSTWPDWGGCQIDIDDAGNFEAYGAPGAVTVVLNFFAPGFHDTETDELPVPSSGIEVLMPRRLVLTGTLLVPENGPPVTSYGVWISQGRGAIGVSPDEEGNFKAQGTRHGLHLKVAHPGPGTVLYTREFVVAPVQGESLGVIDLRTAVAPVDFVVVDGEGKPRPYLHVVLAADAQEVMVDQIFTDHEGRLFTVLPAEVGRVRFGKQGGTTQEYAVSELTGQMTVLD